EKDLKDIPERILKNLEIVPVTNVAEVLPIALVLNEGETLFKDSPTATPEIKAAPPLEEPIAAH
ncbi:MAG: hypothetical protein ACRCTY_03710, partial [Candidatus Adiutrix sp.]